MWKRMSFLIQICSEYHFHMILKPKKSGWYQKQAGLVVFFGLKRGMKKPVSRLSVSDTKME